VGVKAASQAARAQGEAQWYVDKMREGDRHAALGWSIGGPLGPTASGDEVVGPTNER